MLFAAFALAAETASKLLIASKILIAAGTCMVTAGPVIKELKEEGDEK